MPSGDPRERFPWRSLLARGGGGDGDLPGDVDEDREGDDDEDDVEDLGAAPRRRRSHRNIAHVRLPGPPARSLFAALSRRQRPARRRRYLYPHNRLILLLPTALRIYETEQGGLVVEGVGRHTGQRRRYLWTIVVPGWRSAIKEEEKE